MAVNKDYSNFNLKALSLGPTPGPRAGGDSSYNFFNQRHVITFCSFLNGNMVELANLGEDIALAILICCDVLSILKMEQVCT